jgi:predicted RND superfamily exporter protein
MALDEKYSMKDSLTYSLNKNFYPTLLTSVTTAIGFYSFASAKVKPIAQLGVSVAFGVVFTWIVSYLIFPYFLQKIYKDRNPDATKKLDNPDHFAEKISISKRAHKFTHFLSKFKIPIIIISALIFVTSLYLSSLLEINLHPLEEFPHDHIANRSLRYIENNFGAAVGLQIMIDSGEKDGIKDPVFLKKVDEFSNWLETRPTIDRSIGVHQTIKQLNQRLHRDNPNEYKIPDSRELIAQELFFFTLGLPEGKDIHNRISTHYQHIRLSALWTIHSSKEALDEIAIINKKIDEMGLNAKVTGKNPLLFSLNPYVVQMFFRSFSMALFLITLILIFVLRSIPLGLLALIPNIFPIVFGAGFYYITGNEINVASVLIASVCLGVAVDDSIHFIFEYQKYRLGGMDTKKSIAAILTTTFPALLNTTLVIILGFGAFILGDYVPNQKFGVMSGLILAIALLADITILPAILLLIDRNDKRLSKTNTPS